MKPISPKVINSSLIWASNSYDGLGVNFFTTMERSLVKHIVPRSEKAKTKQKKRTKDKAEVFTPSWVCNLQNNLIDGQVLYVGALKGFHKLFPKGGCLSPRRMEIVFGGKLSVPRELTAQQTRELTSAVRERVLELKGDDKPLFKLQDPFRA